MTQPEAAVECFGVMLRAGTPPSLASCNAVLTLCAARGDCELAFDVHRRMANAGVRSDTTTFNQLVRLDSALLRSPSERRSPGQR
jgi:pentatricopeptide repeat protein